MYEKNTYDALLTEGLAQVSSDVLKNEGSLVYNAISVLAFELERFYIQADYLLKQIDPSTADYENLVKLCAQRGIYPEEATHCQVRLVGDAEIPVGSRFNLSAYNYIVTSKLSKLECIAKCETAGSAPNGLTGSCTPITYVEGLTSAKITDVLVIGTDASSKEELLAEYKNSFDSASFGGNVAEYKLKLNAFDGIGGCKIYPVWNGGGTVKAVLIGTDHRAVSDYLVKQIQEEMCPTPKAGYGIAAIGHDMTVASVEEITVNISTKITFMTGYSWSACKEAIVKAIEAYLESQRSAWSDGDETTFVTVYISRIESAILTVQGVLDVGDTTLNNSASNLVLSWEQVPVVGEVESK